MTAHPVRNALRASLASWWRRNICATATTPELSRLDRMDGLT